MVPEGHCYPGTLSCNHVTVTPLKIGYLWMKSAGT